MGEIQKIRMGNSDYSMRVRLCLLLWSKLEVFPQQEHKGLWKYLLKLYINVYQLLWDQKMILKRSWKPTKTGRVEFFKIYFIPRLVDLILLLTYRLSAVKLVTSKY